MFSIFISIRCILDQKVYFFHENIICDIHRNHIIALLPLFYLVLIYQLFFPLAELKAVWLACQIENQQAACLDSLVWQHFFIEPTSDSNTAVGSG